MNQLNIYLRQKEHEILSSDSLHRAVLVCLYSKFFNLNIEGFNDSPYQEEEKAAYWGYVGLPDEKKTEAKQLLQTIIGKSPIKPGVHYSNKPILLAGIYLLAERLGDSEALGKIKNEISSNIKNFCLFDQLLLSVSSGITPPKAEEINIAKESTNNLLALYALDVLFPETGKQAAEIKETIVNRLGQFVATIDISFREIFLIKFFLHSELKNRFKFKEHDGKSIVKSILSNFQDSVIKITGQRRENREAFKINDEYDVQDLLYAVLKPIFPTIQTEDYTPKYGGLSKRIDLVLPSEDIVIEVKIIREGDGEKKFIEELNTDISTYHKHPNTKTLFGFVYDPLHKITNHNWFDELNGKRSHEDISYEVEIIVNPR